MRPLSFLVLLFVSCCPSPVLFMVCAGGVSCGRYVARPYMSAGGEVREDVKEKSLTQTRYGKTASVIFQRISIGAVEARVNGRRLASSGNKTNGPRKEETSPVPVVQTTKQRSKEQGTRNTPPQSEHELTFLFGLRLCVCIGPPFPRGADCLMRRRRTGPADPPLHRHEQADGGAQGPGASPGHRARFSPPVHDLR